MYLAMSGRSRLAWATILPIIDGVGFAIIEVATQAELGWVKPIWDPSIPYLIGMFIILSVPWVYWRNFWLWLYSTVIAFWSEDAFYWVFAWEVPHSWGFYITWDGVPLLYIPAAAITAFALIMYTRSQSNTAKKHSASVEVF